MTLLKLTATRYVLPLREGGSLPAIVDTDCDAEYVVKFRGAGQGPKALVAEAIATGLAQVLSLPVPQGAIIDMAEGFASGEPNPEIQDLLRASTGKNFGLAFLPGAMGFDAAADADRVDATLAASIVWFDALISNVDRTVRNPNLLVWEEKLWMIDHGAAFYFQHSAPDLVSRAGDRFPMIAEHILLAHAGGLRDVHDRYRAQLTPAVLEGVVRDVPDEWLDNPAESHRQRFHEYLSLRLNGRLDWLQEAEDAGKRL